MSRPEDSRYICWVDLECTGNGPNDHILEVGAVMTDRDLNELGSYTDVAHIYPTSLELMDPIVVQMHTVNGLLKEALATVKGENDIDLELVDWIRQWTKGDHIPLAGSGVTHFDRWYIRKDLPRFNNYLSYWAYDVGVIRRTLKLFGIELPDADLKHSKTHRALDDIRVHIEEMKVYRDTLKRWRGGALIGALHGSHSHPAWDDASWWKPEKVPLGGDGNPI